MSVQKNRVLISLGFLGVGAATVIGLAPGGWGRAEPVEVTRGGSASVYRRMVEETTGWHGAAEFGSDAALVILLVAMAVVWWFGRRRGPHVTARALLVGLGATVAYGMSEAVKLVVDQERPCRALAALPVAECPPIGDWSFPSNHSTIAGALAVGLALLAPRLAVVALPLGVVAAVLRVVAGAHYPHDVIAGLVLGVTVTAAAVLALMPLSARLTGALGTLPGVRVLVAVQPRS